MRSARSVLCAVWASAVAASVLPAAPASATQARKAERPSAPPPPFQGRLAEARALAADRNVPLIVVAVFEDEAWNPKDHHDQVDLRKALLSGRELAPLLQRAVVALGCNRPHELESVEVGEGEGRGEVRRCPSYHSSSCAVHQRLFEDAYAAWNTDGALVSPYVVLLAPDGEVAMVRADGKAPTAPELQQAIEQAQKAAGPGLAADEHARVLELGAEGRAAAQAGHHGRSWRTFEQVLGLTQNTGHAEEARAGREAAEGALETAVAQTGRELEAGRVVEGYRLLADLAQEWAGTPRERELGLRVRELEQDKRHRAAIRAYKREREAEAIFVEVEAIQASGDTRRAAAKLRGLYARYADTQAAARAKQRWPALAGQS